MLINWLAYTYTDFQGYGKYSSRMVMALRKAGVTVRPELAGAATHPDWLLAERGLTWDCPTVSCMPPYHLCKLPKGAGPHWLLTMTEGSELPKGNKDPEKGAITDTWAEMIAKAGIDRVIVPCEHNAKVFRDGGVNVPISVSAGGTDPDEFSLITGRRPRPHTFLALADRGERKGWYEAYAAFFKAFGAVKDTGPQDVRLIIKCRPEGSKLIDMIVALCKNIDPRITYLRDDIATMRELYEQVDCFVIPSRTEGWGMPHREAAMSGLPVITQAWSGLDDGHTREWAIVVEEGRMQPIYEQGNIAGEWRVADIDELAHHMRACYDEPEAYRRRAYYARQWLSTHQTWDESAACLIALMREQRVLQRERVFA